jgi:hypothetical protein
MLRACMSFIQYWVNKINKKIFSKHEIKLWKYYFL